VPSDVPDGHAPCYVVRLGAPLPVLLAMIGLAHALPPNRTVRLWVIGDGNGDQVERMDISADGMVVVGRTRGDKKAWLLDVDRWTMTQFSGATSTDTCGVTGAAVIDLEDGTKEIWLSCEEGKLVGKTWDGLVIGDVVGSAATPLTFEAIGEQLSGVWWHESEELLYTISVIADPAGTGYYTANEVAQIHVVDPFAELVDFDVFIYFPKAFGFADFNEAVVVDDTDQIVVSHGGDNMSTLLLGGGSQAPQQAHFTTFFNCLDMHPTPFSTVYCVDPIGQVAEYFPATSMFNVLGLGVLLDPQAVVVSDDPEDGWIAVTGLQVKVWLMEPNGTVPSSIPYFEGPEDADNQIQDMVTRDSYIFGGGVSGNLHIVTARPWVRPTQFTATPTEGATGTVVTVSFVVDQDADWKLYRGGDRFGNGGVLLGSGSIGAEKTGTATITLDDDWEEGANAVYLIATNDDDLTGHARVDITVDNPPDPPILTNGNVSFADEALILRFDGIEDADLDHYTVFVSETSFEAADWPSGGPDFDGTTTLATPLTIEAAPNEAIDHRIQPLENYVTYYIGVHAWDEGGKEGPMSKVVSGMPEPTFTAAELAGEKGGGPCDTGAALGLGAVPLAALLLRRRRAVAAALITVGLTVASAPAHAQAQYAQEGDGIPFWERKDLTRARGDFEIRYGNINLEDESISRVYDERPTNLLMAEFGGQIYRVVELDVGLGFFQELSHTISAGGEPSGDRTMLTWWPLMADASLRAHIFDEQPLVPFVRYGWDYVPWSEKADNAAGGKDTVHGAKLGTHWAVGGAILLDAIGPQRASLLEAQTGINDSYITVEYRDQVIDDRKTPWGKPSGEPHLVFSGASVTVGLKIDY